MSVKLIRLLVWTVMVLFGAVFSIPAAEWQWFVPVPPASGRKGETPRAYLWIPPGWAS